MSVSEPVLWQIRFAQKRNLMQFLKYKSKYRHVEHFRREKKHKMEKSKCCKLGKCAKMALDVVQTTLNMQRKVIILFKKLRVNATREANVYVGGCHRGFWAYWRGHLCEVLVLIEFRQFVTKVGGVIYSLPSMHQVLKGQESVADHLLSWWFKVSKCPSETDSGGPCCLKQSCTWRDAKLQVGRSFRCFFFHLQRLKL